MTRAGARVDVYSRDLGGIHMQELGGAAAAGARAGRLDGRTRPAARLHADPAAARRAGVDRVARAARLHRPPHQPADSGADRGADAISPAATGISGWPPRATTRWAAPSTAFNDMAEQLRRNRERLVYLTQMSSWETLARKTAHELKNSLTPIRLTVEEMLARQPQSDRAFMQQAAQIVISEIETLERRVRAFSEFASEPPVNPEPLDINAIVTERVSLLKPAHPETTYRCTLDAAAPAVHAGADLVKGILTNLLENAAEAAGPGGTVDATTRQHGPRGRGGSARLGSRPRRGSGAHALRADDHVQEARDGPRAVDRPEERAADGRRPHARRGRARRRRLPRHPPAPCVAPSLQTRPTGHDPQTPHHHRRRRAQHRPVAAPDPRRRGLRA